MSKLSTQLRQAHEQALMHERMAAAAKRAVADMLLNARQDLGDGFMKWATSPECPLPATALRDYLENAGLVRER